jgi:hypothetical protein
MSDVKTQGLKFYRHPSSGARYAAYGANHVRVERGEQWGEFNRDGVWLEGQIRFADPTFCRWVSGEHIYNATLANAPSSVWPQTRLGRQKTDRAS